MDLQRLASTLLGKKRAETNTVITDATTRTYIGTATSTSEDGSVYVELSEDVTLPDDDDGTHGLGVEMPTTVNVDEGDEVLVTVFGGGTMKSPVVTGNPGWGDRVQTQVDNAETLAQQAEAVAQEAAEEVEQVRQDVADFRDDVATTYATKVEREDGDDAVKTWVTTNYTNSNDLATTYATKTLVSQTKDAIELAASQTYETQSDAAATYATKAALTVGLDGIRSEVAEDYQPKGDYATTASMNSAIQQSASSIESSVAATYTTKAEFEGLQVGGTNLASDVKLWYTRMASSEFTAQGITVKQLGDGLYSAIGTTTGKGDIWFQTTNIDASLSRDPGDYVMSAYVESGTWPSSNFYLQLAAYRLSDNAWNRNIRTANGSTSQAFTCTSDYPRHFGFYSNTSGVEVNITFRLKLERGNVPTDWSPAPEDMATTYATKTEVQQTASGLDTRITTATNTANSAKSAVDNLQVGGTNLLWDSAFDDIANTWLKWGTPTTYEVVNVNGVNFLHVKTSGARFQGIQQNDSKRAGVGEISAGEKFVFSVDAYGATSTQLNVGIHWLNSSHGVVSQNWFAFNIGTTPERYVHVDGLTAPTNAVAVNIMIGNNTADVRELWFAHPKLERGTIATDWSPAPEDMATEAALDAEVTERQTLIRQFSGGVLAGYVGNAVAALVNAAGSFDVVRTAWANGVPSILGTLARYAASGISLFDAAGNTLAEFASDHVRIGGDVPDGTGVESAVQFFDQTETHDTDMTASTYFDGDGTYQTMQSTVNLSSTLADEGKAIDTGSSGTAALDLVNMLENGISDVGEQHNEVHAALVADASYSDGATTSHAAVRATASTLNGSNLSYAELIADALGIGENEGAIDYFTMDAVRSAFPVTLYDNASASASAAASLSETAANFSRLTIFYRDGDGNHASADVWQPDGKRVALAVTWISGASTQEMYQRVRWVTISGTTISTYKASSDAKYRTGQVKLGATASVTNADYISIVHVIGWR